MVRPCIPEGCSCQTDAHGSHAPSSSISSGAPQRPVCRSTHLPSASRKRPGSMSRPWGHPSPPILGPPCTRCSTNRARRSGPPRPSAAIASAALPTAEIPAGNARRILPPARSESDSPCARTSTGAPASRQSPDRPTSTPRPAPIRSLDTATCRCPPSRRRTARRSACPDRHSPVRGAAAPSGSTRTRSLASCAQSTSVSPLRNPSPALGSECARRTAPVRNPR